MDKMIPVLNVMLIELMELTIICNPSHRSWNTHTKNFSYEEAYIKVSILHSSFNVHKSTSTQVIELAKVQVLIICCMKSWSGSEVSISGEVATHVKSDTLLVQLPCIFYMGV